MWEQEPDDDGVRRFGKWAGNPKGHREDVTCCVCSVAVGERSQLFRQCSRKRGYGRDGLFCKQHAKRYPATEQ